MIKVIKRRIGPDEGKDGTTNEDQPSNGLFGDEPEYTVGLYWFVLHGNCF
jgi:hypothetical protein